MRFFAIAATVVLIVLSVVGMVGGFALLARRLPRRVERTVTGLLQQVLLTILAATAGVMAVLLLGTGGGPRVTTAVSLYQRSATTCWLSAWSSHCGSWS